MANDCIPFKRPGEDITGLATAAITGKRCVQVTADMAGGKPTTGLGTSSTGGLPKVGHPNASGAPGAAKMVLGVAKYDAASGARVGIIRGGIVPIEASAAITHGVEVEVGADGRVATLASGVSIGTCLADCSGAGIEAIIALRV